MHISITDSHLHLWDDKNLNYAWLANVPMLNRSFLPSDLLDATKSLHIESFLFVQSGCNVEQSLAEAQWVCNLAKRDPRIYGIVAHASLELGEDVRTHLQALKEIKLVKGVRRVLLAEKDDFCLQKTFVDGVQLLAEFGLSFDITASPQQLPAVLSLVEQCPQVKFILDHVGMPDIEKKTLQPWQEHITQLAAFPNVWCKLSGIVTNANHQTWRSDDLKPFVYHAIKEFSYDRVMFGSDWPVVNLASSYAHWVHILCDLLMHNNATEEDLRKLFSENARRCYELHAQLVEIS